MKDKRKGADRKVGVPESDVATCISSFLYFFVPFSFLSFFISLSSLTYFTAV